MAQKVPEPPALLTGLRTATLTLLSSMLFPALFGAARAFLSGIPMAWYGNLPVVYATFVPAGIAGVFLPHCFPSNLRKTDFTQAAAMSPLEQLRQNAFGTVFLFASIAFGLTYAGVHSGFMAAAWALGGLIAALLVFPTQNSNTISSRTHTYNTEANGNSVNKPTAAAAAAGDGFQSEPFSFSDWGWTKVFILIASFSAPLLMCLASATTIPAHLVEKMGLAGATPGPLGLVIPDIVVGFISGFSVSLCLGTFTPYVLVLPGGKNGLRKVTMVLLGLAVAGAVWGSIQGAPMPYSYRHPKRIFVQHFHHHQPNVSFFKRFCILIVSW